MQCWSNSVADVCLLLPCPHAQVSACFAHLGQDSVMVCLPPEDAAVACAIFAHRSFRQGQVWQAVAAELDGEGVVPTPEDA